MIHESTHPPNAPPAQPFAAHWVAFRYLLGAPRSLRSATSPTIAPGALSWSSSRSCFSRNSGGTNRPPLRGGRFSEQRPISSPSPPSSSPCTRRHSCCRDSAQQQQIYPAIGCIVGLHFIGLWFATRSARFLHITAGMCVVSLLSMIVPFTWQTIGLRHVLLGAGNAAGPLACFQQH